jgi:hypothetical protein
MNSLALLEYAYDQGIERGINCLNLSFILTESLISIGIPARIVGIYPVSPYDNDNHVVTHAYIAELDKWIMLDPTWSSYFRDADGNILNVVELRGVLAGGIPPDGRELILNDEFAYNGDKLIANEERVDYYLSYLAKDLFYYAIYEITGFGRDNIGKELYICPVGFDPVERFVYYTEYMIALVKREKNISEEDRASYLESLGAQREFAIKYAQEEEPFFLSPEDLLARPGLINE